MFKDERNRSALLFFFTIIFTIMLSYIPADTKVFNYQPKKIDLFMDIVPDSLLDFSNIQSEQKSVESNLFYGAMNKEVLEALIAYANLPTGFNVMDDNIQGKNIPLSGDVSQMNYFFQALKQAKSKKVRIADYGDSGNEGDMTTADIRERFQSEFGGNGVGMLAITSQDISFRTTTRQSFSDNWKTVSVLTGKEGDIPIGINGFVSIPKGVAWVQYETRGSYKSSKYFTTAKVYYTNAKGSSIKYSFNTGGEKTATLQPGKGVKELVLTSSGNATSFKMTTTMVDQAQFFGVSLESGNGVYMDNYPWRGNSGVSFKDIQDIVKKDFQKYLDYKLIILTYGANMMTAGNINFTWYENQMIKVIEDLKTYFPQTSILLVGMGDRPTKRGSKIVTDPNVYKMIQSQKNIVNATGITFWSKFDAMGGENSMLDWVSANLASQDYGHLNELGAKKMAGMISDLLLNEYRKK
jgi:lysophospholipase L1-like esterase